MCVCVFSKIESHCGYSWYLILSTSAYTPWKIRKLLKIVYQDFLWPQTKANCLMLIEKECNEQQLKKGRLGFYLFHNFTKAGYKYHVYGEIWVRPVVPLLSQRHCWSLVWIMGYDYVRCCHWRSQVMGAWNLCTIFAASWESIVISK